MTIYTFNLTAALMVELCRVERFGVHANGVQRRFKERRAMSIALAMSVDPDTTFTENPRGSLENGWTFEDGCLRYTEGAYIVLDDGQHRRGALEMLTDEERANWEFVVTCTQDVPYPVRLKLFLQQDKGERIDSRLRLSMRHEINDWDNENQRRAYDLCVDLAHDPRSPLKDMIILEETDTRPYEGRHRPAGINVSGMHNAFTSLMSRTSPLATLPPEKQLEVCKNIIRAAAKVWGKSWKNSGHCLTTAKGINAVLKLIISGRSFRIAAEGNFTYENLVNVFGHAAKFDWSAKRSVGESESQLRDRLDAAIGNSLSRLSTSGEIKA